MSRANRADTAKLRKFAREALVDIALPAEVGEFVAVRDEGDEVSTYLFESKKGGYRGWNWSVSVAIVEGEPSVLEAELIPGDEALLSPAWVPWADRLAEYRASQAEAAAAERAARGDDSDDDDADDDDLDESDDEFDDDDDDDDSDDDEFDDDDEFLPEDREDRDDIDGVDIDALADNNDGDDNDDDADEEE